MAEKTFQLTRTGALAIPVEESEPQPVREWVEKDGRRTPTGPQLKNAEGIPLWELAHNVFVVAYDRAVPEVIKVRYASLDGTLPKPVPARPAMPKGDEK